MNTTLELQAFQMNASEELKKKEGEIQKLLHLLQQTTQERDEARSQLNLLLKKLIPESPTNLIHPRANSTTTESDSNGSFFDQETVVESTHNAAFDARLEQLVNNRPLPEKGKLLDAVMRAGPLLQSLMVAGPLPRWKNPPPLQRPQIPPVSVNGRSTPLVQSSVNGFYNEGFNHGFMMKRAVGLHCVGGFEGLNAKRQRSQ